MRTLNYFKSSTRFLLISITLFQASSCLPTRDHLKIYTKPIVENVDTLDPSKTRFRTDYMITRSIMGQLLQLDSLGEVKPSIFESWQVNKAGTEYIFKLRKNVHLHSGRTIQLDDVVYTFHYLASKDSLINQLFSDIDGFSEYTEGKAQALKGIKKENEFEIKITLTSPSFLFLANLADPKVTFVPNQLDGKTRADFFNQPNGAGPYKLKFRTPEGSQVFLESFSDYFGGKAQIPEIHFQKMKINDAIESFKSEKVQDLELFTIPLNQHEPISSISNQFAVSAYSTSYIFFNGRMPVFKSIETRKKIATAVNITPLISSCAVPFRKSVGFIPHGVLGWVDPKYELKQINQKIIKKTPLSIKPLRFVTYGDDNNRCVINGLVEQLKSAGIPVHHEHITQEEIVSRLEKGTYDMFFEYLSVRGSEPHHLLTYFDPRSRHNIIWFQDPTISQMSDRIKSSPAKQVRASLYRQLDQYLSLEKAYFVPLYSDIRNYFFSKKVRGPTVPAMITMNNGFEEIQLK